MVQKVVWTQTAYSQKISVYEFWNQKNGSPAYSKQLEIAVNNAVELLQKVPHLGVKTQVEHLRVKIIKNYLLIYRVTNDTLYILLFWDSRQNPDDLKRLIGLYQ